MTTTDDKNEILTVGFTDSQKKALDSFNADRFKITHKSTTKDGLESLLNGTIYDTLLVKDGAWPERAGRSAIDCRDLFGQMLDVPKLLIEAVDSNMSIGIAYPDHNKKPVVQNLNDLEGLKNAEKTIAFNVATNEDLKALFDAVVPVTNEKTSVKEDSEKEEASIR